MLSTRNIDNWVVECDTKKKTGYKFTIKELPDEEKPRERLIGFGPSALSNAELLAIILRIGNPGVVSFLLLTLSFEVAFAVGILAGFGLKFLPLPFGMDITKFDKKKWLGNGIMYILTWLAVLMILCNLPI